MLIVTNNPLVTEKFAEECPLDFVDGSYGDVLIEVNRQIIEEKVQLLSHPLSGSIKPNETYYKTIFISETNSQVIDLESLEYSESAMTVYEKFIQNKQRPNRSLAVLRDFALVDFYIAQSTLDRMGRRKRSGGL